MVLWLWVVNGDWGWLQPVTVVMEVLWMVCVVEEEGCLLLLKSFVVMGANWQVAPPFFFQAQT
jgi:hypothetical protein